jgi:hypothetical protein
MPDEFVWKVLVSHAMCLSSDFIFERVHIKELCESGLFSSSTGDNCLNWFIRVEYDHMLAGKMNLLVGERSNRNLLNYTGGSYLKAFN